MSIKSARSVNTELMALSRPSGPSQYDMRLAAPSSGTQLGGAPSLQLHTPSRSKPSAAPPSSMSRSERSATTTSSDSPLSAVPGGSGGRASAQLGLSPP